MVLRMKAAWTRRLLLLRILLQRGEVSTARAAAILGVDRRVARKDLEALSQHGVPLGHEGEGRARRWVLQDAWRHVGLEVRFVDTLALLFCREIAGGFLRGTPIGAALDRLSDQIAALRDDKSEQPAFLERRFHCVHEPEKDYQEHTATLARIIEALLYGVQVSLVYRHARDGREEEFPSAQPLTLLVYKRGLYLVIERRDERPLLAVERIVHFELQGDVRLAYPTPAQYHPARLLEHRYGVTSAGHPPSEVRLRFDAKVVEYVATRRWAADQRIEALPDGGCELSFVATGRELVPLALGFGDKVEVLAPAWLRAAVRSELRRASSQYDADGEA